MKAIIFFGWAAAGLLLAQEQPSDSGDSAQAEKDRAIAINQELKDVAQGATPAARGGQ